MVRRAPTSMTSTPPSSDMDSEWDHLQEDAIPLPESNSKAMEALMENLEMGSNRARTRTSLERGWDKTIEKLADFRGKMTVAEVVRQMANKSSIKFIAVIGLTGAGKSSVIKTLTGEDVHISHSIKAGTTTFAMFPAIIEGERYILIDTPGFNDENQSDIEIFSIILKWFQTMSQYCNLAGILYVHDISQKRVSGSAKLNLDMLKALCGPGFYKNVTILTTMWGDAGPSKASERQQKASESRQKEFENGPWKELIDGGARVMAHKCGFAEPDSEDFPVDSDDIAELDEQREEAREELFRMIDYYKYSESISPEIQSELRRGVGLLETKAGAVLRKSKGLPPTPETIDGEGKTAPSIPATVRIDDKAGVLQSASTIHVIHHIVESPPLDTGLGGKEGKNLNEKPKDPPPRGWWENLFRAVFWFFTGSGDSKKKQS